MKFLPMKKQEEAIKFMLKTPRSGAFMRMGTGKTVSCLTVIDLLMYEMTMMRRVILFAPLRVAEITWLDEIRKWDHTKHLTYAFIHGKSKKEDLIAARDCDILAINFEGAKWLYDHRDLFCHFDAMIVDESTWIKNHAAIRTDIIHKLGRFIPRITILSGSPAPNSLEDLWSQIYLLDRGKRLGQNITEYRRRYFFKDDHRHGYFLKKGAKKEIVDSIADLVIVVDQKDQEGIPIVHNNLIKFALPEKLKKQYDELEEDLFTTIDSGYSIHALNQQAKAQKLRQFISGFVYKSDYTVVKIHEERLKVLAELIQSLSGNNVLVAIQFREEVNMIQDYLKRHLRMRDVPFINSESKKSDDTKNIRLWQEGKLPVFLAHPGSIAHGLNLQAGGSDIIWYSLTWSLEEWEQYIARLARMGQLSAKVINHVLTMIGTIDIPIFSAINRKDATQQSLMTDLKEWRENKKSGKRL